MLMTNGLISTLSERDRLLIVCARLQEQLGIERLEQLANLIDDVIADTHWGGVEIIIAEGRIIRLKAVKSYP
jgi:hypothetical protein